MNILQKTTKESLIR